jgi:diguanylate cyclase (GGDEF)-like protein/PAS domain S-box-containing protein
MPGAEDMTRNALRHAPAAGDRAEARLAELEASNAQLRRELERLRQAQTEQTSDQALFQTLIDQLPDYLYAKDIDSRFIIANRSIALDHGCASGAEMKGKTDFDLHAPELAEQFFATEQAIIASGQSRIALEERMIDAAGKERWTATTKVPLRDANGTIVGLLGVGRDITARKRAEFLATGQAEVLEMIARNAPLADVLDRLMRLIESQFQGLLSSILLLSEDGLRLLHGAAPSLPDDYNKAIDGVRIGPKVGSCGTAAFRRQQVVVSDIAADPLWEDFRDLAASFGLRSCWSTPILSHQGKVLGTFAIYSGEVREPGAKEIGLISMITRIAGIAIERQQAQERIQFMAHHDALTGLPNRSLLNDRLQQAILYGQRYHRWVTVAFVDLDNFKLINDSLGHSAGDELLKIVADRMASCIRDTDTVVRLGGDEFVVLLFDQPNSPEMITASLQRMRALIAEPARVDGRSLQVTCSMGLAIYPNDGKDIETLLSNADAAMYRAKEVGRNNIQFYTAEMNSAVQGKLALQAELRGALARGEFRLVYQPQIDLRSGELFAAEALLRWDHPAQGVLTPGAFLPMAEESGLMAAIGDWVLDTACRQNKAWQNAGLQPIRICVNVSARQFRQRGFAAGVAEVLRESGLEPRDLELELTESVLMIDAEQAVATMAELRAIGVSLSIDDFGTGYSSLATLKALPVARLKLDQSFVRDIADDENDRAIVAAVISLGQKLNLRVIAEGVETEEQLAFLRANNCDEMQGHLISEPVDAADFANLLRKAAA